MKPEDVPTREEIERLALDYGCSVQYDGNLGSRVDGKITAIMSAFDRLYAALSACRAERDALREDAERYRFIMSGKRYGVIDREGSSLMVLQGTAFNEVIDAAIDQARKEGT